MTIGEMIQTARKQAGLTQSQLGERLGVSGAMIGQWENGLRNPKSETIMRIAETIGKPFSDLYLLEKSKEHFASIVAQKGADDAAAVAIADTVNNISCLNRLEEKFPLVLSERFLHHQDTMELLTLFNFLNDDGRQEAIRSVEIIAGNPVYQRTHTERPSETP